MALDVWACQRAGFVHSSCGNGFKFRATQYDQLRIDQEERARRIKLEGDARRTVFDFLKARGFDTNDDKLNLNAPKKSLWGFGCTYPLQEAAAEKNWKMVRLLIYFGADPTRLQHHRLHLASYLARCTQNCSKVKLFDEALLSF